MDNQEESNLLILSSLVINEFILESLKSAKSIIINKEDNTSIKISLENGIIKEYEKEEVKNFVEILRENNSYKVSTRTPVINYRKDEEYTKTFFGFRKDSAKKGNVLLNDDLATYNDIYQTSSPKDYLNDYFINYDETHYEYNEFDRLIKEVHSTKNKSDSICFSSSIYYTYEGEKIISNVIHKLKDVFAGKVTIHNTFLAAHAIPQGFKKSKCFRL